MLGRELWAHVLAKMGAMYYTVDDSDVDEEIGVLFGKDYRLDFPSFLLSGLERRGVCPAGVSHRLTPCQMACLTLCRNSMGV